MSDIHKTGILDISWSEATAEFSLAASIAIRIEFKLAKLIGLTATETTLQTFATLIASSLWMSLGMY